MSHPPIPPKCEFFRMRMTTAAIGCRPMMCFDFELGRWIPVSSALNGERKIISAVAEVEWRKRAARWEDLKDRIYFSWEGGAPSKEHEARFERMQYACNVAYENVQAWREWGKQK